MSMPIYLDTDTPEQIANKLLHNRGYTNYASCRHSETGFTAKEKGLPSDMTRFIVGAKDKESFDLLESAAKKSGLDIRDSFDHIHYFIVVEAIAKSEVEEKLKDLYTYIRTID